MFITNVVYGGDLNRRFDLTELAGRLSNVRYDPKSFPGLIWQHRRIGGNCLLFSNGKINCNGKARSFERGKRRLREYARLIQKMGYDVRLTGVKLITASASHELSGPLRLHELARERGATYEPEIFPALVVKRDGVTFSCFHTGKLSVTGIKSRRDIAHVAYPAFVEFELYTT